MGINIRGTYKGQRSPYELDMSYSTFHSLRFVIAKHFNDIFYQHYSTLLKYRTDSEWDAWNKKTDEIIVAEHLEDARWKCKVLDFLFAPDTNGKISYGTCKRIYDLIKDEPDDDLYGYPMIGINTMGTFKKLLHDVYLNGGTLKWD